MRNIEHTSPAVVEDQLCFQLYAASRVVTGAYREGLSRIGLTYPQYLALLALWDRNPLTVSEIAEVLDLDSGTVSPLLARLEAQGLVSKIRGGSDARSVSVHLTDEGAALEHKAAEVRRSVEQATGLTADEFTRLRRTLQNLRFNVAASK